MVDFAMRTPWNSSLIRPLHRERRSICATIHRLPFVLVARRQRSNHSCVQLEGVADERLVSTMTTTTDHAADQDNHEERLRQLYLEIFPDGRDRVNTLPAGIAYFCVWRTWLRFSDYAKDPPQIVELDGDLLRQLA
jgi:hypothetical protein